MNYRTTMVTILVIVIYIGLTLAMSHVASFNKGPDEETNLAYTAFIIAQGRLPITYEERELVGKDSNWPALYHLIVGGISRTMGVEVNGPPTIKIFWDSFRYQTIDTGQDEWFYLRTEDELWPFAGRILVLHLGRWLSILFGVVTVGLVYGVTLELWPGRSGLALAAASILAFTPTFTFMSAVMNEDTMMAALTTIYFWLLILIVKRPARTGLYFILGLILGVSVTVKYTTIILPLEIIIVVAVLAARQQANRWWWGLQRLALAGMGTIIGSSWWFGWNFWYLNEVEELGWLAGLMRPIFTGGPDVTLARLGYFFSGGEIGLPTLPPDRDIGSLTEWLPKTALSFFGISNYGAVALSPYVYLFLGPLLVVAALGVWKLWRTDAAARRWLLLCLLHIGVFFILPLLRFALSRRIGETAQGRHILMPAAAAVVILLVWGLATAIPVRWHKVGFSTIVAVFAIWAGLHWWRLVQFTPTPVPLRTVPAAAERLPEPANVQFGEGLELVTYQVTLRPDQGRLDLALAWRSLAHVNENYRINVELLDEQDQVVSTWLGFHGNGQVPTLAWDPGDTVMDRITLPLPDLADGRYRLQLQLLSGQTPVPTVDQAETFLLHEVTLDAPTDVAYPHYLSGLDDSSSSPVEANYAIWSAAGPVDGQAEFRYPGTITVVTAQPDLELLLRDEHGGTWPATRQVQRIHVFVIGPRWQSGDYALQLSLNQDDQTVEARSAPLISVENWWERDFTTPPIETPVEANFADQLQLLGYYLPQTTVQAGQAFPLTLYLQAPDDKSPQAGFTQFNNVINGSGQVLGGYDRQPLEYYNTLLWAPGEVVVDGYAVPVAADAPPGDYYLDVGYYLAIGEGSVTLPLVVDGQMTEQTSVRVGPIRVVAP